MKWFLFLVHFLITFLNKCNSAMVCEVLTVIVSPQQLVDDDGSLDAALINYLFAKQMVERLRNSADVKDLQRKRSYWKQCAFNAVSCFGKRK